MTAVPPTREDVMLAIGTVVRVTDKESTFEGWSGTVSGLYGQNGVNGVYVRFTSDYGYTERLMFPNQLEETTPELEEQRQNEPEDPSLDIETPEDARTCRCGNYLLSPTLGASPIFTIEAVTGLPNGPMEAHTVEQCFAEVQARADLDQCAKDWREDKGRMFPLAAKHPIFAMGTHSCCSDCGALVDLSAENAYAGGLVRCDEHAAEWREGDREHAAELEADRKAELWGDR